MLARGSCLLQNVQSGTPREYPIIILTMLRLCGRRVQQVCVSEKNKKENLKDLISTHYGASISRHALDNSIKDMIAIGLPITKTSDGVSFDFSNYLDKNCIEVINNCISNSRLQESEKSRLIEKLNNKFHIDKY